MQTINLKQYYPFCTEDTFVEVSDEVWEVMRQAQREMNNYERRKVYHLSLIHILLPRMMEAAGVTEELKAHDPMRWVGLMNTLKAQVEEMILKEIVFE